MCYSGAGEEWWLFPILARMEFDTKERYKFFGCHRQRSCGIGSGTRKGHSAFRKCTPHSSRIDLHRKRKIVAGEIPASDETIEESARSLQRRGIHPYHVCTALQHARHCVLQWPERIHHGLFAFDVMHCLYINCIGYLQDALLSLLTPKGKQLLNTRVKSFTSFRNPHDGKTTTTVSSLTSIGYMTAEMKVVHLFIWSHAIGSKAMIFVEELRRDVLLSVSSLQVMCFSVRGNRPFSEAEHRYIWDHHGKIFFRSMGNLVSHKRQQQIHAAEQFNVGKPPAKRRRVPYWKDVEKIVGESTNTVSSSDSSAPPFFARSEKIVPHGILHFADQVIKGGTHHFHDTSATEACHIENIQFAGQRARIYKDVNSSSNSMLNYQMEYRLMQNIIAVKTGIT